MDREIKFRAWTGERMVFPCEVSLCGGAINRTFEDGYVETCPPPEGTIDDYELMQFTGLKDKNGVEIYEGDIIGEEDVFHFIERFTDEKQWEQETGNWKIIGEKTKNFTGKEEEKYIAGYKLHTVRWQEQETGFYPFADSPENCCHCGGGSKASDFEVIGNIYENPELLK